MKSIVSRRRRIARTIVIGSVAALSLTSLYAFKTVFARPGEGELQLVPASALIAGSIDLRPGPAQAMTFKNIDDSLSRNGVKEPMERSFIELIDPSPEGKELAQLATRSAAACMLESPDKKGDYDGVLMMPLTDAGQGLNILEKYGREEFWKGTKFYRMSGSKAAMMMAGTTLVVCQSPWAMHEIGLVMSGAKPSLGSQPDFVAARNQEPSDSNLLVFMSPSFVKEQQEKTGQTATVG